MIENERVRTRSRMSRSWTLCFLYSLVLFNSWVLANAELTNNSVFGGVYSKITQTDMKIIIMMQVLPWNGRYEEPPPWVSLAGSADTCRTSTLSCHFRSNFHETACCNNEFKHCIYFCRRFLRRTYRSTAMHPSPQSTSARLEF